MTVATFVIIDLVAYSDIQRHLTASLGIDGAVALDRQIQKLIGNAIVDSGGSIARNRHKTSGDGAILAFDTADMALDCAARLHDAAAAYNRGVNGPPDIRVFRVGITTGELVVDELAGGVVSMAISEAARLEAGAAAGGVLIDAATRERSGPGLRAAYRGPETVKGKRDEVFEAWSTVIDPDAVRNAQKLIAFFKSERTRDTLSNEISDDFSRLEPDLFGLLMDRIAMPALERPPADSPPMRRANRIILWAEARDALQLLADELRGLVGAPEPGLPDRPIEAEGQDAHQHEANGAKALATGGSLHRLVCGAPLEKMPIQRGDRALFEFVLNGNTRLIALEAIGRMQPDDAASFLERIARDEPDPERRRANCHLAALALQTTPALHRDSLGSIVLGIADSLDHRDGYSTHTLLEQAAGELFRGPLGSKIRDLSVRGVLDAPDARSLRARAMWLLHGVEKRGDLDDSQIARIVHRLADQLRAPNSPDAAAAAIELVELGFQSRIPLIDRLPAGAGEALTDALMQVSSSRLPWAGLAAWALGWTTRILDTGSRIATPPESLITRLTMALLDPEVAMLSQAYLARTLAALVMRGEPREDYTYAWAVVADTPGKAHAALAPPPAAPTWLSPLIGDLRDRLHQWPEDSFPAFGLALALGDMGIFDERSATVLGNYLLSYQPDLQFSTKAIEHIAHAGGEYAIEQLLRVASESNSFSEASRCFLALIGLKSIPALRGMQAVMMDHAALRADFEETVNEFLRIL